MVKPYLFNIYTYKRFYEAQKLDFKPSPCKHLNHRMKLHIRLLKCFVLKTLILKQNIWEASYHASFVQLFKCLNGLGLEIKTLDTKVKINNKYILFINPTIKLENYAKVGVDLKVFTWFVPIGKERAREIRDKNIKYSKNSKGLHMLRPHILRLGCCQCL